MGDRLFNEGPKWIILAVYFLINIGLFVGYFTVFQYGVQYHYLRLILGLALPFARSSAVPLNFNCLLILLPVCRNLITLVRGSARKCCKRNVLRQLDKNIAFHKLCAYAICFWTAVHYYAHSFNFDRFLNAYNHPTADNQTKDLLLTLSLLPNTPNGTWINPVRTPNTNPILEAIKSVPGITGVVITLALILMVSSATEFIRRSYFEVFWFTHHLFVIFFIGLVTHGLGGVVRGQVNVDKHDPVNCSAYFKEWGSPRRPQCPFPEFGPGGAVTWKWVIGPICLYIVERLVRFIRSQRKVTICKVVKHPSRVVELQMQRAGFEMESGQYIFINCPSVSRLEWHPFTLTSAPQEDFFSVHIRLAGDWTNALAKACHVDEGEGLDIAKLPKISVDGPFGTCSEDVYRYQVATLVAAGIGVTPFASVLKDIWYKHCDPSFEMKLRKVYLYWICPDTNAFEWFVDLLQSVEEQMLERGEADFLSINIFWTKGWNPKQANIIGKTVDENRDVITGLLQKTQFGRPNWENEFNNISQAHPGVRVGVFFCGPKALSTQLHLVSNKYSSSDPKGTHFVYNKENF